MSIAFEIWCFMTKYLLARGYGTGYLQHMVNEIRQTRTRDRLRT